MAEIISSIEQLTVGDVVFVDGFTPELVTRSVQKMVGDDALMDDEDRANETMNPSKKKQEVSQTTYTSHVDKFPADMLYQVLGVDNPKILIQSHPDFLDGMAVTRVLDIRTANITKTSVKFAKMCIDAFRAAAESNKTEAIYRALDTITSTSEIKKGTTDKKTSRRNFMEDLMTSLAGAGLKATVIPMPPKDSTEPTDEKKDPKTRKPRKSKTTPTENTENNQA